MFWFSMGYFVDKMRVFSTSCARGFFLLYATMKAIDISTNFLWTLAIQKELQVRCRPFEQMRKGAWEQNWDFVSSRLIVLKLCPY